MPLTPAELVRLEDEYGSLEAAAEAIPEQREELLAAAGSSRSIWQRYEQQQKEIGEAGQRQLRAIQAVREQVWRSMEEVAVSGDDAREAEREEPDARAERWR